VDIDRRSGYTFQKKVDIQFAYPYFMMSTDRNDWLGHPLLFTVTNFKRFSLNKMLTERDHDGHGDKSVLNWCWLWQNFVIYTYRYVLEQVCKLDLKRYALTWKSALDSSGDRLELEKKNSTSKVHRLQKCGHAAAAAGFALFDLNNPCEKTKKDQWPMVPTVVNNGPSQSSTNNSMVPQVVRNGPNTHANIDTNSPIYQLVGQSRSISTVDLIPPTGEHSRYRRSFRLHLRRIAVDRDRR